MLSPDTGSDVCGLFLTIVSYFLIAITFPISVFMCIKVRGAGVALCHTVT